MTYDIKINLSPSESDLKIIEKWLIEEDKKYKSGFYCNWNIIEKSFRSNELISLKCNENLIGFMIWSKGEIYIEIDIIEIQRGYRKKGFGKIFFEKIEEVFKGKNALAIKLFCEPKESEHFWKKMGFIKFPTRGYSESDLTYYKPLIDALESTENPNDCKQSVNPVLFS